MTGNNKYTTGTYSRLMEVAEQKNRGRSPTPASMKPAEILEGEHSANPPHKSHQSPYSGKPTKQETNEVTFDRTADVDEVKRRKARHTFDVYKDQILSLKEIQLVRERRAGKRFLIGDLVQEALDGFIAKEKSNGRSNVR